MANRKDENHDQGIPQALIDEAELDSVEFALKSGQKTVMKQELKDAKGLNRLAYDKAIEWDKRVQLVLADGKSEDEAMEAAYLEVFDDMSSAKLLAPVKRFLELYSARYTENVKSFLDSKSAANTRAERVYIDNGEHRGSQWEH